MGFRLAAIGPLRVHDFGGLDIQTAVYQNLAPEIASGMEIPATVREIVERGDQGHKTGRGFYDYSGDERINAPAERDARYLALLKLLYGPEVTR
jgi:3-hydroxybutyryl-CoA dehydrogenase